MGIFQKKIAVFALAALAMGASFPHGADAKPGHGAPDRQEMNLTAEQRAAFKKIMDESRAAMADTKNALENKKDELDNLLKSENPDTSRVEALSREIGELRGKLMVARINANAQLRKAGLQIDIMKKAKKHDERGGFNLTSEQKAAAKKIIGESKKATEGVRQALTAKKAELDTLMRGEAPDAAKIESVSREIGELRGQLLAARAETSAKLRQAGLPADFGKNFGGKKPHDGGKFQKHGQKGE